jgi:hypothetical protein
MLVFKHLFYYNILLEVKVVEVTGAQYFSRSKKHLSEMPVPLMEMYHVRILAENRFSKFSRTLEIFALSLEVLS